MSDEEEFLKLCDHRWVSNSGRGGTPDFRLHSMMSVAPTMHVKCSKCGDRTWMTEVEWYSIAKR